MNETIDVNRDTLKVNWSDTNSDGNSIPVTLSMLSYLRISHKKDLYKPFGSTNGVHIYADNGGAFLKYKINKKFENSEFLCNKLLRYQVTNKLKDNMNMFKMNCLVYALSQTGIFSETEIQSMMCRCFDKYISHKQLEDFGRKFGIKFVVNKWKESKNQWMNITNGKKKFIGSYDEDATVVKLAIYHKHYILDEQIQGISLFAIKNYDAIKKAHPDKDDEWIFSCVEKRKNGSFKSNKAKATIMSHKFVEMMTNDNKEFSFEEQYMMSSSLWDVIKSQI